MDILIPTKYKNITASALIKSGAGILKEMHINSTTAGTIKIFDATVVKATTKRARASNVATITTAAAHGFVAGNIIVIRELGGTGYNGTATVASAPTTTTLTYANTGDNEAEAADTAGFVLDKGGNLINNTITPAKGNHNLGNAAFNTGLYCLVGETADVTIYYN